MRDISFGKMSTDPVISRMEEKAAGMPEEDILVYCVSCSEAMFVGGKRPRYLLDLLFGEETIRRTADPDRRRVALDVFIWKHKDYGTRKSA